MTEGGFGPGIMPVLLSVLVLVLIVHWLIASIMMPLYVKKIMRHVDEIKDYSEKQVNNLRAMNAALSEMVAMQKTVSANRESEPIGEPS